MYMPFTNTSCPNNHIICMPIMTEIVCNTRRDVHISTSISSHFGAKQCKCRLIVGCSAQA